MPYREHDAYEQKMCDMADAADRCYETICEQLLSGGVADYYDKEGEHQVAFLDEIKKRHDKEFWEGENLRGFIEAEAKRIAESIF